MEQVILKLRLTSRQRDKRAREALRLEEEIAQRRQAFEASIAADVARQTELRAAALTGVEAKSFPVKEARNFEARKVVLYCMVGRRKHIVQERNMTDAELNQELFSPLSHP